MLTDRRYVNTVNMRAPGRPWYDDPMTPTVQKAQNPQLCRVNPRIVRLAKLRAVQLGTSVQGYVTRLIENDAEGVAHIIDEDENGETPNHAR